MLSIALDLQEIRPALEKKTMLGAYAKELQLVQRGSRGGAGQRERLKDLEGEKGALPSHSAPLLPHPLLSTLPPR